MNILVVEDRGSVSFYLEDTLRSRGHEVYSACSIADAQSYWDEERIDCIITDSNMSPDGLSDEEVQQTKQGLLTGWVWLVSHVLEHNDKMRTRTIIYTDYLERIREIVPQADLRNIRLLPKKGSTSPARQLLDEVDKIALRVKEEQSGPSV